MGRRGGVSWGIDWDRYDDTPKGSGLSDPTGPESNLLGSDLTKNENSGSIRHLQACQESLRLHCKCLQLPVMPGVRSKTALVSLRCLPFEPDEKCTPNLLCGRDCHNPPNPPSLHKLMLKILAPKLAFFATSMKVQAVLY